MPTMSMAASAAASPNASVAASAATAKSLAASAVDFATLVKPFTPDAFANGFATLIGALIGAMLAYVLQRKFQKSIEHRNSLLAAHRLMFSLLQQINTIVLIQRDYVFAEIDNRGRFLSIPATPPFDTNKNVLEISDLSFLLEEKKGRAILYELYIAQENYVEALNQWNMRSDLHLGKIQPAMAASRIVNGAATTEDELLNALGVQLHGWIVNSTDNCILTLKRAFQKLKDAKINTRQYLTHRFRTDDFLDFDFPETFRLEAASNGDGLKSERK